MLGKLLKYDFLAVGRKLFPIYAALFISVIGLNINIAISGLMEISFIGGIFAFLFGLSNFAVVIGTIVVIIRHFYVSLFTDQGYFNFVLPVGEGTQLVSKLLNGAIYTIISALAIFISTIITATNSVSFETVGYILRQIIGAIDALNSVGLSYGYIWFVIIVYIINILFAGQIYAYFCIVVGQLWSKHRVLGAILVAIGLYIVNVIVVSSFAMNFVAPLISLNEMDTLTYEGLNIIMNYGTAMVNFSAIYTVIECIIGYIICWFVLKKRTNIE